MPEPVRFSVLEYPGLDPSLPAVVDSLTRSGLGGLGLSWYRPAGLGRGALEQALLGGSSLQVSYVWPEIVSLLPVDDGSSANPHDRLGAIAAFLPVARDWRAAGVGLVTGPVRVGRERHDIEWCSRGIAALAQEANLLGLRVGFEPVHSTLVRRYSFLSSIAEGARFLRGTGAGNVGLIADSWHLEGTDIAGDLRADGDMVLHAHLSDGPASGARQEYDRFLPGAGDGASLALVRSLEQVDYAGLYEVEVLASRDAPAAWGLGEVLGTIRRNVLGYSATGEDHRLGSRVP